MRRARGSRRARRQLHHLHLPTSAPHRGSRQPDPAAIVTARLGRSSPRLPPVHRGRNDRRPIGCECRAGCPAVERVRRLVSQPHHRCRHGNPPPKPPASASPTVVTGHSWIPSAPESRQARLLPLAVTLRRDNLLPKRPCLTRRPPRARAGPSSAIYSTSCRSRRDCSRHRRPGSSLTGRLSLDSTSSGCHRVVSHPPADRRSKRLSRLLFAPAPGHRRERASRTW